MGNISEWGSVCCPYSNLGFIFRPVEEKNKSRKIVEGKERKVDEMRTWPVQGMVEEAFIVDKREGTVRGIWKSPEQGRKH